MSAFKILVYWPKERSWSIVSELAVEEDGSGVFPGKKTLAKYKGMWFPAIIIGQDDQKALKKAEERFKEFLNNCLQEEDENDIDKCILEYATGDVCKSDGERVIVTKKKTQKGKADADKSGDVCKSDKERVIVTQKKTPKGNSDANKSAVSKLKEQKKQLDMDKVKAKKLQLNQIISARQTSSHTTTTSLHHKSPTLCHQTNHHISTQLSHQTETPTSPNQHLIQSPPDLIHQFSTPPRQQTSTSLNQQTSTPPSHHHHMSTLLSHQTTTPPNHQTSTPQSHHQTPIESQLLHIHHMSTPLSHQTTTPPSHQTSTPQSHLQTPIESQPHRIHHMPTPLSHQNTSTPNSHSTTTPSKRAQSIWKPSDPYVTQLLETNCDLQEQNNQLEQDNRKLKAENDAYRKQMANRRFQVTPRKISFLKNLAASFEEEQPVKRPILTCETSKKPSKRHCDEPKTEPTTSEAIPNTQITEPSINEWDKTMTKNGDKKVRLMANRNIYIPQTKLSTALLVGTDPRKLSIQLLEIFFTREQLANGNASGKRQAHNNSSIPTKQLNQLVLQAILDFVLVKFKLENGEPVMSLTDYNKLVNAKCATARRGLKL